MSTTFSNPEGVAAPVGLYSHVARTDLGNVALLFISGQVGIDPSGNLVGKGDAAAQAEQIYANLRAILEANGGTLRDIVKLTTFVTDIADRARMADLRKRTFPENPPASTLVEVSKLASDDWLVEVEAVAVVRT